MSVLAGQPVDRKLAIEEAQIAAIVQGFLEVQARAAGPTEPPPGDPRERCVRKGAVRGLRRHRRVRSGACGKARQGHLRPARCLSGDGTVLQFRPDGETVILNPTFAPCHLPSISPRPVSATR